MSPSKDSKSQTPPPGKLFSALLATALFTLSSCGGGSSNPPARTYSLSATISGLDSSGLVLTVDGTSVSVTNGAGTQLLAGSLASGTQYSVAVATQPTGQTCSVAGGSGTITSANVANVVVTCSDQAFNLGGTISGLGNNSGLVLVNGSDTLTVASGATSFTMPTPVAYSSSYGVTVQTQPSGLACSVTNGTGTMPASAVTSVVVSCTDQPFTVGGAISGLGNNSGLVLTNGTDTLMVAAGATGFTMPAQVAYGSSYDVIAQSSPAGLTCSVANGSGTMGAGNVSNITVTCSDQAFDLGGTISGLGNNSGLVLVNGSDTLTVAAGATGFTMPAQVAYGSSYDVIAQSSPAGLTCSVANGSGTMPASAVTNVAVTCSVDTYTIGGSISGLDDTGLVLLDNGGDATSIAANAAQFTMHTGLAYGAAYDVTVGTQPYGIGLACTPSDASGTATANVNSVAISCANATPIQNAIASYFNFTTGVAVDTHGNVFVAEPNSNTVEEMPYNGTSYGVPVPIGSGFSEPSGVAVDANDNVFVADTVNNAVKEIPYSGGSYGAPVTLGSGLSGPFGVAVDANDNVFVADQGNSAVEEIPYSGGVYGAPVMLGSGFRSPSGVAVDANDNVFVADTFNNAVKEIPYSGGSYGAPVTLGSGFGSPYGVAVDANDNVFVADTDNNAVKEIPYSGGSYGAPVTLGSGFSSPHGVAVDADDNVFVADSDNSVVKEIPYSGGSYGVPVTLGSGLGSPALVAVDANDNVFVTANNAVKEIPYSGGSYGAPVTLGSGFSNPIGVAVDANDNVFVADSGNNAVKEIPYSGGSYGAPVTLGSGFSAPYGVAVDANDNVFVADFGNSAVEEIPYSGGVYGAPVTLGSGFSSPIGVAVDANDNVFVADYANNAVKEIPYSGGVYGAPVTLGSEFNQPTGVAVDANDNVFVADASTNAVDEIPYNGTSYGVPVTLGSGFSYPTGVAVDANGRLYAIDQLHLWMFVP